MVDLCAEAIAAREAEIGAFAALDLAAARRAAARAAGLPQLPLRGLPVGIKDIFDTADFANRLWLADLCRASAAADAAMVMLVRRAGGVVLGKTVTTQFASLEPRRHAQPAQPAHTPGGSSSGSAAAVAAGMLPLALGSQTGGSVIRPAAYCGVAGFKPSFRLLPTAGMKCFSWSLDTVGLFAAGVADVAFAAAAVSGRDLLVDGRPPAPPVIALTAHPSVERGERRRCRPRSSARRAPPSARDAKIKDLVLPPIFERAPRPRTHIVEDYEAFRALAFEYDHHRDRARARRSARNSTGGRRSTPTPMTSPPHHAARPPGVRRPARRRRGDPHTVGAGRRPARSSVDRRADLQPALDAVGHALRQCPGLTDPAGLPLGVQIVARFGRDRFALAAAAFLEQALAATRHG